MSNTDNLAEQTIHGIGSLNQEAHAANNSNNPSAEVVATAVVTQGEQSTQESTFHPEPVVLHESGEFVPALISLHTLLFVLVSVTLVGRALGVDLDVNLDVDPDPNPAHTTLMGSLHGIGGVQDAENEVPENLAAVVPAGQNSQEPMVLLEHAVPDQVAFPHAPFAQPFVPVQAMPAATAVAVAQPAAPAANNNPGHQPLLRSLHGFEGIQFEDEGDDEGN
ncbi:hypothetical protein FS749_002271 [Ceratobasidium sp. UAMH 11750]|nr:hypothetical protein FS749_002271 [Ceratobasidium sp. UAMH 11750]